MAKLSQRRKQKELWVNAILRSSKSLLMPLVDMTGERWRAEIVIDADALKTALDRPEPLELFDGRLPKDRWTAQWDWEYSIVWESRCHLLEMISEAKPIVAEGHPFCLLCDHQFISADEVAMWVLALPTRAWWSYSHMADRKHGCAYAICAACGADAERGGLGLGWWKRLSRRFEEGVPKLRTLDVGRCPLPPGWSGLMEFLPGV